MRNYIPMNDVLSRDPKWAARIRERANVSRRRVRADPKHRARLMLQAVKDEAKRKGVTFSLSLQWFQARLDGGVCEMSGMPFDFRTKKRGTPNANTASVDRIVAGGDYTENNCRMILFCINNSLRDFGESYILEVFGRVIARRAERR
jgi:hypothetical protein